MLNGRGLSSFGHQIRTGQWLTPARLRGYTAILVVAYAVAAVLWIALAHGLVDRNDKPISTDFANVYAAGTLALASEPAAAYDWTRDNRFFNRAVGHLFSPGFTDILSGYRVLSRRFAKSFQVTSTGFEIETELSVHALDLKIATAEIPLPYGARPQGSHSKLRTYRDGLRILGAILMLYKELQPLRFFGAIDAAMTVAAVGLALPLAKTYAETRLVPRLPTAILATGMVQLGVLSFAVGLLLDSLARSRREAKRMRYLNLRSVAENA